MGTEGYFVKYIIAIDILPPLVWAYSEILNNSQDLTAFRAGKGQAQRYASTMSTKTGDGTARLDYGAAP
ncbi:MAG: hypothetical protein DHS20C05_03520 [Hyphococcus sp.]|nr:MAG: hypothetical protein DHS20C05_03520 [Marinicaulis sp.]